MSRVLPILFNGDMVCSILDGRKTVTRRVIKPQPCISCEGLENECRHEEGFYDMGGNEWACRKCGYGVIPIRGDSWIRAPYQPDDIIYVRETWFYEHHMEDLTEGEPDLPSGRYAHRYVYKADNPDYPVNTGVGAKGWRPSIHMSKEAARIWLKVTDVRVERLQDISGGELLKEGIDKSLLFDGNVRNAFDKFSQLWDSTIKKQDLDRYGWAANPWVWAIEFERCEKPETIN